MLYFESDYTEGAHEKILERLAETNRISVSGYGEDPFCASAKEKIRAACAAPDADIFFLVGGTQTNATVIASLLPPYAGAVSAESGHIGHHEAGAIEHGGHKVLPLPQTDGKLSADTLETYLKDFYAIPEHLHMVQPGMVYISHPTEYGTLYTKAELTALHRVCRDYALPLFLDGARLGYGLASPETDVTLPDLAALCDVFYIGGTKVGALCGEAVVFPHGAPKCFFTIVKQNGALLAKGRLLGIQFDTLFTDDLYLEISRHAVRMAMRIRKMLLDRGYRMLIDSPTNQQFPILDDEQYARLAKNVKFCDWERIDETHRAVRFAASWATTEEQLDALEALL